MKKLTYITLTFIACAICACKTLKPDSHYFNPVGYFSNKDNRIWVELKEDSTFNLVNHDLRTFSKGKWQNNGRKITLYCLPSQDILDYLVSATFISDTVYSAKIKSQDKIVLNKMILHRN